MLEQFLSASEVVFYFNDLQVIHCLWRLDSYIRQQTEMEVPPRSTASGDEDPLYLPFNSKRFTRQHARALAKALGLPTTGSCEDTIQMLTGKLKGPEHRCQTRNSQVLVRGDKVQLSDDNGTFLEAELEEEEEAHAETSTQAKAKKSRCPKKAWREAARKKVLSASGRRRRHYSRKLNARSNASSTSGPGIASC